MTVEINSSRDPKAVAVLLHPHPHMGGDRFHPFVDALFRSLPDLGITSARFDFASADPQTAHDAVVAAIDTVTDDNAELPVVLAGYSFGAGVASQVVDERVVAWCLLAPPVQLLTNSSIGDDPRPKLVLVPSEDQYSPPVAVDDVVASWRATEVAVIDGTDHFLGDALGTIISTSTDWIVQQI